MFPAFFCSWFWLKWPTSLMSSVWKGLRFPVEFQGFKPWCSHWMCMKEPLAAFYIILFCLIFLSFISPSCPFDPEVTRAASQTLSNQEVSQLLSAELAGGYSKIFMWVEFFVTTDLWKLNIISVKNEFLMNSWHYSPCTNSVLMLFGS